MENKIFVIYVGVGNVPLEDIGEYTKRVAEKIAPKTVGSETIVVPVMDNDTRIECINPKYITDVDLINEHTEQIKKINKELLFQLEQIKKINKELLFQLEQIKKQNKDE